MQTPAPRRAALSALALPLILALALLGASPSTSAVADPAGAQVAARATGVKVSPRVPLPGERTAFSGSLAGDGRSVTLQRKVGKRWKVADRAQVRKGRYRLVTRVKRSGRFRVHAPAGAGRPAWTSKRIRVRVATQSAAITAVAAPFVVGVRRTVSARVLPARKGRSVLLQRRSGGSWSTVAKARSNGRGNATIGYVATPVGQAPYRVVGASFRGSRTVASAAQTVRTAPRTELLSPGTAAAGESWEPSISNNGRWVTFSSDSPLLPADGDSYGDVYLLDRVTGDLTLLLPEANSHTNSAVISGNGRFVVLQTLGSNVWPGDTNGKYDVFVLDRTTGALDLISQTAANPDTPSNGTSSAYGISDDGRFVAYVSTADNLVRALSKPPNTSVRHPYVHDRTTGINRALDKMGSTWSTVNIYGFDISGDGSAVAFHSSDQDLTPLAEVNDTAVFRTDINTDGTIANRTNLTPGVDAHSPQLSHDGDIVLFAADADLVAADTNGQTDAYLRTASGALLLAAPAGPGESWPYDISRDGRYVALDTESPLVGDTNGASADVVIWDRVTGTHRLVSAGGSAHSSEPQLSAAGDVVVFGSQGLASTPAVGDWNVFARVLR